MTQSRPSQGSGKSVDQSADFSGSSPLFMVWYHPGWLTKRRVTKLARNICFFFFLFCHILSLHFAQFCCFCFDFFLLFFFSLSFHCLSPSYADPFFSIYEIIRFFFSHSYEECDALILAFFLLILLVSVILTTYWTPDRKPRLAQGELGTTFDVAPVSTVQLWKLRKRTSARGVQAGLIWPSYKPLLLKRPTHTC